MIKPKMRFIGTEALVSNCRRLPIRMRKATRDATLAVAWLIHNDAKMMCPVDTGRLRASISVNWTDSGMEFGAVRGKTTAKPGRMPSVPQDGVKRPPKIMKGFYAAVGTRVEYAEDVEGRSPYLWPAFAMNKAKYKAALERIIRIKMASAI